ncbi:polyketide cyclase [Actinomadura sp. CNU-125]|uniref:SRPBCC family protein n=1 Tax=Actinomadura sp. CNU-125 TaxID=1904961 RepID=UPI0009621386|nr:SRPBCC family protein [Actinomadura sp. CNU-125]OLT10691.1 polyketide cyclase [Actinomadura sp. CNU-125]
MSAHTDNAVTIAAPMDLVWEMTNDIESWPELFTEYGATEVLHRDGITVRFRLSLHPDENGVVRSWVSDRTADPESRTVRSQRVELGPFKYMFLFWEYVQTDEGILLRWVQDFELKPGMPIDDDGMAHRLNTNSVIQMKAIKETIEAAARG